ncbi:tyrosine-type recombinase/integrase [Lactococcus cremoris]|uniref:tyrosine-type recombinase/integrase n=1 Tax=Lactococcus lactis subsp. cremoris TaxID=1359 RepID=UPI0035BC6222
MENDDTRSKEIIQWFLDHNNSGINDDYIFVRKNGHLLSDDTMNRYLHRFEKQMPDKLSSSFVMHSLRHSYITRRAEAGDTETEIMAKVGHANPNLVHTLYTHVRDTLKFDEQKKFKKQPRLLKIGKSA